MTEATLYLVIYLLQLIVHMNSEQTPAVCVLKPKITQR